MTRILLLLLTWPIVANAQVLSGKVTMGKSGLSVRGAGLVLMDSAGRPRMAALTDSAGTYTMSVNTGSYQLRVTGPNGSDQTVTPFFAVAKENVTHVDVALASSTRLADVRVRATRDVEAPAGNPHKFDEFILRRDLGAGHFMTREQIRLKNPRRSRDLLDGIPGITVRQEADSSVIQSARCSGRSVPGLDAGSLDRRTPGGAENKKRQPMLFVDGHRMSDVHAMDDIAPGDIEAIEVFQGASELPAEAKGDACFAIYIWLRAGD